MNKLFYKFVSNFDFIPIEILVRITKEKMVLPFYHSVSDRDLIHLKHLYPVRTIREFEKDLDFFLKHFKPVSYEELFNNGNIIKKSFVLSFDDGLREFHDIIAPVLLRKGIPAICFLNSGFVGNKDLFFRYKCSILIEKLINSEFPVSRTNEIKEWFNQKKLHFGNLFESLKSISYYNRFDLDTLAVMLEVDFDAYLKQEKPYLDEGQINSLINQGFTFGAHSVDHPYYDGLQLDEQLKQTKQSVDYVAHQFSQKHKLFAFPFTDYGIKKCFFNTIFNAEDPVADLTFGTAGLKKDTALHNLQRIAIERDNFSANEIVKGEYLYYFFKSLIGKNRIKRM